MRKFSATDRKLLDEIQFRFPVCARPFAALGVRLNLGEKAVIARLRRMRKEGVIRRIGPVYDAHACGLATVLVALSVPDERVREAAKTINACDGVTHNYARRHALNIWFTLTSRDREAQRTTLRSLRRRIAPDRWLELPRTAVFKIGLLMRLARAAGRAEAPVRAKRGAPPRALSGEIPFDLPLSSRPFPRGAVSAVRRMRASGRIRRFGAVLDEKRLGYRFSALVAWMVEPARLHSAGRRLASFPEVSHCYAREKKRSWRYSLYTVVHARDRGSGLRVVSEMAHAAGLREYVVLETARRLKRSSLRI